MDPFYIMVEDNNKKQLTRFSKSDYLFFFIGELSIKLVNKNSFLLNSAT